MEKYKATEVNLLGHVFEHGWWIVVSVPDWGIAINGLLVLAAPIFSYWAALDALIILVVAIRAVITNVSFLSL